jgi:dimethylhistidine N-methyltransferase/ergothioneine biosynthesis protein EgtC
MTRGLGVCRHLGYLGPEMSLASLLFARPHSLLHQSWAPADMRGGGTVNVDGFGVGWYPARAGQPVRYRRCVPMWTDGGFASVARVTASPAVLAAVRSGTVGMPVSDGACAPFTEGPWLFSHNGLITGWPGSVAALAERLPTVDLLTLDAPTDSALLWALVRRRLRAGEPPDEAVAAVTSQVTETAPDSRLNLMLTDGRTLVATAWWHSLSVLCTPDTVVVASEPWDDDRRWSPVPDRCLLVASVDPAGTPQVRIDQLEPAGHGRPAAASAPLVDVHSAEDHAARALAHDVRSGLTGTPKSLPPRWFYDASGSELFEQITRLAEYYPTRAEREILAARAGQIAEITEAHTLVELGSGSSDKTRLLLSALQHTGTLCQIVAMDVSATPLREASVALSAEYPSVTVHGVVGDFTEHLDLLPGEPPRLVAFLGGTIGNLLPPQRAKFLASVRDVLREGEWLLLGTDLVKDVGVLVRAYDDSAGVTAEFNRNVLRVLNRELAADFDLDAFEHVALWDADNEWIEMRLRARRAMRVGIGALDLEVEFAEREELRTEISAKFRREGVADELSNAGFDLRHWWTDTGGRFALSLSCAIG